MDTGRSNGIISNGETSPPQHQQQQQPTQTVPPLQRFLTHVSHLSKVIAPSQDDDDVLDGFSSEFDALKAQSDAWKESGVIPAKAGALPFNIKRNRYRDIVPFDHARVVLAPSGSGADEVDGADYINASFLKLPHDASTILNDDHHHHDAVGGGGSTTVNGANGKSRLEIFHRILADSNSRYDRYIAAQGPLAKTLDDFWLMIWQQNIKVIVMACRTVEYARQKCEQYWPPDVTTTTTTAGDDTSVKIFGKIRVRLNSKDTRKPSSDYIVRTLMVERTDAPSGQASRIVKQFHYTNWYDHDIPDDASAQTEIINFLRLVREEQPPSPSSSSSSLSSSSTTSSSLPPPPPPILVHCSAGCGRTGTLIAIDYVWSLLKRGGIRDDLDLFKIVRFMRFQRSAMVQTKEQYRLVYSTLAKIFHGYLDALKLDLLVEIETTDGTAAVGHEDEPHDYENWKPPLGQQRKNQREQRPSNASTAVNSYENIIPALLMNQEAVEAAAAAAENQKQRKLNNNGRYDENAWRKKQQMTQQQQQLQHPLLRSNATRHHQSQQHPHPQQHAEAAAFSSSPLPYVNIETPTLIQQQQQQYQNCDTSVGALGGTPSNASSLVLPNIPSLTSDGGNSGRKSHHGSLSSLSPEGGKGGGGGGGSAVAAAAAAAVSTTSGSSISPVESIYVNHDVHSPSAPTAAAAPTASAATASSSMSRSIALSNLLSTKALDSNLLGLRRSPPLNFSSLDNSVVSSASNCSAAAASAAAGASESVVTSAPRQGAAVSAMSPFVAKSPSAINKNNNNNISALNSKTASAGGKSETLPECQQDRQEEEERKKLTQSSAEILSGLDELDALINAEMESVRHMQLTLAKDPATEALHKRIEDSRQIVGAFQQQPNHSPPTGGVGGGGFPRQRSSSLSRSRSGGGGVFGGGGVGGIHPPGAFLDGSSSSGVVVNLRGSAPPVVTGGGGVVVVSGVVGPNAASKTLPTSDRSQRQSTLRKRFSGGDATDLAVNAAFPAFVNDNVGSFDAASAGVAGASGVGVHRGGGNPLTTTLTTTTTAALPPGWQTMTNWRNQFPPSTASASSLVQTPLYQNLTINATPPPPLPVKQTNVPSSSVLPNLIGGGGVEGDVGGRGVGGGGGGGQKLKPKFV